jgi:hypothetical protein
MQRGTSVNDDYSMDQYDSLGLSPIKVQPEHRKANAEHPSAPATQQK